MPKHFKSYGKLLLTGEYVVLDGAKALAIPTAYSQTLEVYKNDFNLIDWISYDETDSIWFKGQFQVEGLKFQIISASDDDVARRLIQIFKVIHDLNPTIFKSGSGFQFKTTQDFNRLWGLGTSSTLINNLAGWAAIDAFKLLQNTFGGSGYDIACAQNQSPLIYQIDNGNINIEMADFNPKFKAHLYFVYLNRKKNSRDGISYYKSQAKDLSIINEISSITEKIIKTQSFSNFRALLDMHEDLIAKATKQSKINSQFSDFNGTLKSLGAWGGDFMLACAKEDPTSYFKDKGFETIIPYTAMVL